MSLWQFAPPELRWLKIRRDLAIALFDLSLEVRIREEIEEMTISGIPAGSIKARIEAIKQRTQRNRMNALSELDLAARRHDKVDEQIRMLADQFDREASDAMQEFATETNGEADLVADEKYLAEESAKLKKTPMPPAVGITGIITPAPVSAPVAPGAVIEPAK